jgi:hypothetical protein
LRIDNEWFSAEFPAKVETVVREDEGNSGSESSEYRCTLDGEIGVFIVRLTRTKNDLWAEVPAEKRREMSGALTKSLGDALIAEIAKPGFLRKPKFTLDETSAFDDGAFRRLAFSFKRAGVLAQCFLQVVALNGLIYTLYAITAPASERAVSFMAQVKIKALTSGDRSTS